MAADSVRSYLHGFASRRATSPRPSRLQKQVRDIGYHHDVMEVSDSCAADVTHRRPCWPSWTWRSESRRTIIFRLSRPWQTRHRPVPQAGYDLQPRGDHSRRHGLRQGHEGLPQGERVDRAQSLHKVLRQGDRRHARGAPSSMPSQKRISSSRWFSVRDNAVPVAPARSDPCCTSNCYMDGRLA